MEIQGPCETRSREGACRVFRASPLEALALTLLVLDLHVQNHTPPLASEFQVIDDVSPAWDA